MYGLHFLHLKILLVQMIPFNFISDDTLLYHPAKYYEDQETVGSKQAHELKLLRTE